MKRRSPKRTAGGAKRGSPRKGSKRRSPARAVKPKPSSRGGRPKAPVAVKRVPTTRKPPLRDERGRFVKAKPKRAPRTKPRRAAKPPEPRLSRRLQEVEGALELLGAKVKPSRHLVGTRKVTPTKQGFAALRRTVKELSRELAKLAKRGKLRTFTYDLTVSVKREGPIKVVGVGVPRLRDIRPRKGETKAQAVRRVIEEQIRRQVFDTLAGQFKPTPYKARLSKLHGAAARSYLRSVKRSRGAGFRVEFYRET